MKRAKVVRSCADLWRWQLNLNTVKGLSGAGFLLFYDEKEFESRPQEVRGDRTEPTSDTAFEAGRCEGE